MTPQTFLAHVCAYLRRKPYTPYSLAPDGHTGLTVWRAIQAGVAEAPSEADRELAAEIVAAVDPQRDYTLETLARASVDEDCVGLIASLVPRHWGKRHDRLAAPIDHPRRGLPEYGDRTEIEVDIGRAEWDVREATWRIDALAPGGARLHFRARDWMPALLSSPTVRGTVKRTAPRGHGKHRRVVTYLHDVVPV